MWYHLSRNANLPNPLTSLQEPEFAFLDVSEPCFCIAPTVWQCVIAINQPGRRYIYDVDVNKPVSAISNNSNVADFPQTNEYRITQEVLNSQKGQIPLRRIGFIEITSEMLLSFKIAFCGDKCVCDSALELERLWTRLHEEWSLNDNGFQEIKRQHRNLM